MTGPTYIVQAAVELVGGTWQAPVDLSQAGQDASPPQLAVDARGDAVAVWVRYDGNFFIMQASVRPAGGAWRKPIDLSAPGQSAHEPQVAVDPQGDGVAIWDRLNGTNQLVQAAGYDAAGPLLAGVSIPATGIVGIPVSFSVSPLDVFSPIALTTWSFGDGQSVSGASLSHAYAKPGSYTVALSSQDTLANATSTAAQITIAPAPPAAGPAGIPTLTNVSQSHRRWREGSRNATFTRNPKRTPPVGTTFGLSVSQTARVSLVFSQTAAGRRLANTCQAPNKHNRRRPRCRRTAYPWIAGLHGPAGPAPARVPGEDRRQAATARRVHADDRWPRALPPPSALARRRLHFTIVR